MPDITGSRIGGRLEDMQAIQVALDATGAQTGLHAGATSARVQRLQQEVADVTVRLKADFADLAAELRTVVTRSNASLESADWDGRSRGAASAANAQFGNDIERVLGSAHDGADQLHQVLSNQVLTFFDEVNGTFTQILGRIEDNYRTLAAGTRAYATRLAEDDAVAIRFG